MESVRNFTIQYRYPDDGLYVEYCNEIESHLKPGVDFDRIVRLANQTFLRTIEEMARLRKQWPKQNRS